MRDPRVWFLQHAGPFMMGADPGATGGVGVAYLCQNCGEIIIDIEALSD